MRLILGLPGIVHGDLKPQNILIFKDKNGSWLAKVADFGFSKWHTNHLDRLELPRSWPWYAPEYLEYPDFTPQQAMRMDVFSFGMLCLWLIFEKNLSGVIPLANELPDILRSSDGIGCPLKLLAECKHYRLLTEFSHRLVMQETTLDVSTQQKLQRLFSSSLSHEPHQRDIDMVHLVNNIGMAENSVSSEVETNEILGVTDDEFNVRLPKSQHVKALISASSAIRYIRFTEQTFDYDHTFSNA
ncbi:hypothetical protein HD806DRAFT_523435 [Xylariaceae sp. AK1471]|nr:hypothetical protein HD806DRAFT_523435 [Xylariaceae sp. AK1471]